LQRYPARAALGGHMVDFGDDTAGERFNVVRGSQRFPDVWPIFERRSTFV